jgi:hypothetical protein
MEISTCVLFSHLIVDVGKDDGSPIPSSSSPHDAACKSISRSLFKKLNTGSTDRADSAALLKFLASNFRAKNWALQLNTSADEELWGEFKNSLFRFFYPGGMPLLLPDSDLPLSRGSVGSGAAIGAIGEAFYSKMFNSPMSCTSSDLYSMYKGYVSRFPSWFEAEEIRRSTVGDCDVVSGSRLSFVPKNQEISRCICVEPNLNMFCQLGVGSILTSRLADYYGIDIKAQQFRNRDLARIGSIYDNLVTIDLESASDSIGLSFCKEAVPRDMWNLLTRYRCRSTSLPGLGEFELDIVSSMGNGFTFPLQTILFCAMVEAAFRHSPFSFPRGFDHKEWGVFGDDIIVPKGIVTRNLLRLLKLGGFVVNDSKSFFEGCFRESCGADYFSGVDIRGVYLKDIKTPQDIYVAINRLNLFTARTGVRLVNTIQYLLTLVPRILVPLHENEDAGVRVPSTLLRYVKGLATDANGSLLYKAYRPCVRRIKFTDESVLVPKAFRKKGYFYNGSGALVAFLHRSLDACGFSLRLKRVPYKLIRKVTPNWDALPETHPDFGWFPWQRLGDAVYFNVC